MIHTLLSYVHYWLVDHPTISQFEWKEGHTFGSSWLFVATTVITYLSITFILNRLLDLLPPISATTLRYASALHSAFLCLLSLAMAVGCSLGTIHQMPRWKWVLCPPANQTLPHGPTFFWAYVFYLSKIYEFMDTLLILLGGSHSRRRLSFLHLFHHSGVVAAAYLAIVAPPMVAVGLVTNAIVHVLMYAYYLLCAVGYHPTWKKSVTNCQISQFFFLIGVSGLMLYYHFTGSGCSEIWAWFLNFLYTVLVLALFLNFHSTNYSSKNLRKDHEHNN